tara:strand:- start:14 stop:988 length:975 start_codon:yes stop_codon:yes gene_type:complete
MPESITPSSEKLVPIDTSGNAVDVTLKEDKKEDVVATTEEEAPVVEVKEEKVVEEVVEEKPTVKESKEEELEEYSAGVKKRIDKLTKKMREAERREQAAIDYAKQVKEENDKMKSTNVVQTDAMLVEREKALVNQKEFAKRALEAAMTAQDVEKQVAAQQEIARLTIEDERLKVSKAKALQRKNQLETQPKEDINQAIAASDGGSTQKSPADPKAVEWAQKNEWFGTDNPMTYTAYDIHNQLVQEGIDPRDDEYYNEIDKRIRKEFPHKFNDGGEVNKPKQKVASVVRKSASGRRTVRLTPSQVAIAKKLGVPLEEYAKHVKEA